MKYNFDEEICREGTSCEKFDLRDEIFGRDDVIPLWVADMDFAAPPEVTEAIRKRAEHPVLGYSYRSDAYWNAIIGWVERHGGWKLRREWLDFTPGVVSGIVFALRAFTSEGDGVVIQPPVYHPFARQTRLNGRRVRENPLIQAADGRFVVDFDDLDRQLSGAKALLMSNPHNPTGRVFTREELTRIGELCVKHDVLILSDEIHSDLIYDPHRHLHIAALDERFARRTVTFIAPSKTFNMAGLSTSVVIVPDDSLRRRLQTELAKLHADQGNIFGAVALEAAYSRCDEWLEQLIDYLDGNVNYVLDFLRDRMPSVRAVRPEGTYLMWLDFREWPMTHEQTYRLLIDRAGLGVNEGSMFGEQGRGWMRFNIASPRRVIERAMDRLYRAAAAEGLAGPAIRNR